VDDVDALKKEGLSLSEIDTKLFKAFSEQIFHTGFVHADPHPGNGKFSKMIKKLMTTDTVTSQEFHKLIKKE